MTDKQEFRPLTLGQQEELGRQDFITRADPTTFGRALRPEPVAEVAFAPVADTTAESPAAEPLHFAAPSLARQEDAPAVAATVPEEAPVAAANPDDLGMIELVQRLSQSLEKRREQQALEAQLQQAAAAAQPEPAPAAAAASVAQVFEAARPEEAAQAMAAFFGKPAGVPSPRDPAADFTADFSDDLAADFAPEEPVDFAPPPVAAFTAPPEADLPHHFARGLAHLSADEPSSDEDDGEEDEYLPASFSLPLRGTLPVAAAAEELAEADDEETEFGSLLALNNPYMQKEPAFVRVDEPENADALPPAGGVVFPGQARDGADAADPGSRMFDRPASGATARKPSPEMDEALRSALTKLQRMSGAA